MLVRLERRHVRSMVRRCVGTVVIAAAILAKPTIPAAEDGGYKYTIIFGPGGGGPAAGQPYVPPAINDTGTVVARTDCSSLVLGDGTTQRNALAPLSCRGDGIISINNAGMVALDSAYAVGNQSYDQIVATLGDKRHHRRCRSTRLSDCGSRFGVRPRRRYRAFRRILDQQQPFRRSGRRRLHLRASERRSAAPDSDRLRSNGAYGVRARVRRRTVDQ